MTLGRLIPHSASLAVQLFLLCLLTLALYVAPSGKDPVIIWPVIALFYVYFVRSFFAPTRIRFDIPTYTTIETLFLMFYFLLFINPYQSDLMGFSDLRNNTFLRFAYEAGSNQAIIAAGLGFVAFHLGLSWSKRGTARRPTPLPADISEGPYYRAYGYMVLFLLAASIGIYEIAGFQSADEGRYTKITNGGPIADGIYLIISMLSILAISRAIAILAQRKKLDLPIFFSLVVVAYWSARILLNGDRNTFFLIAIAAGGGFFTFIRRTSWVALIACVLGSLVIYTAVETIRMSQDRSFSGLLQKAFEEKSNKEANSSSSFTITTATLRASFDIVPERRDYGFGRYKLIGFAGIIPLIRGSILEGNSTSFATTAEVLSYFMLGPSAGWSVGSNLISDIYMDFGIVGIPVLMSLLGLFAGEVQRRAAAQPFSTRTITFYLLVLANFGELSRYSLDFPVRMLAWTLLLFLIYDFGMKATGLRLGPSLTARMRSTKRV